MYAWFYQQGELLSLPIVAMILFMAVFCIVVWRVVMGKDAKQRSARLAMLPLEDGTVASVKVHGGDND